MAVKQPYHGIPRSTLVLEGIRLHKETGSPFDSTQIAPGTPKFHKVFDGEPDPLAFSVGASRPASALSRPDPSSYLTRRSGSGGMASSIQKEYVGSPLRPMTSPVSGRLTTIFPDLESAHQAMVLTARSSSRPGSPTSRRPMSAFPGSPTSAGLTGGRESFSAAAAAAAGLTVSSPRGSPRPGSAHPSAGGGGGGALSSSGHFGSASAALGVNGGGLGITGVGMSLSPLRGPPPGGAKR
jgi:hypothetical protein